MYKEVYKEFEIFFIKVKWTSLRFIVRGYKDA